MWALHSLQVSLFMQRDQAIAGGRLFDADLAGEICRRYGAASLKDQIHRFTIPRRETADRLCFFQGVQRRAQKHRYVLRVSNVAYDVTSGFVLAADNQTELPVTASLNVFSEREYNVAQNRCRRTERAKVNYPDCGSFLTIAGYKTLNNLSMGVVPYRQTRARRDEPDIELYRFQWSLPSA